MPVKHEPWAAGTPAWVDLMVPDVEAAKEFYSGLFGWEYDEGGEEFGNYLTATLDGEAVAGLGPVQGPGGPPPQWTTYLAAEDAEAVSSAVTGAGGSVLVPAMQVGPFGAMAVVADPTGTVFGLWQSGEHTGVDRYNEPGALVWNEAMVGDYEQGRDFYTEVFGYTYTDIGEGMPYSTFELSGTTVGGIGAVSMLGDAPPQWRSYFQVADVAATCAKAAELGGMVIDPPRASAYGTMATIAGPSGETFCINQAPEEAG